MQKGDKKEKLRQLNKVLKKKKKKFEKKVGYRTNKNLKFSQLE